MYCKRIIAPKKLELIYIFCYPFRYKFLASRTPHTALHLGLLQKAKFEFHQGSVRKITSRPLSSSVPNNRTTSEILLQGASIENVSIVNDLDDLPLKHVSSKLELNTSRRGYFTHKLQPMFAECTRYATLSGPTTKEHPSNLERIAKNDTALDNSSEIIDADLPVYRYLESCFSVKYESIF